MIPLNLKILAGITSVIFFCFIIYLLTKRKLNEKMTLIWIVFITFIIAIAANFNIVITISKLLGIEDPNNTIYFFGFIYIFLVLIFYSIDISHMNKKIIKLIQVVSILQQEIQEGKKTKVTGK